MRGWVVLFLSLVGFIQSSRVHFGQDVKENTGLNKITFSDHIRPIFKNKCIRCHNSKLFFFGGLRLNSLKWIKKGGDSGPVIVPYDPGESLLNQLVKSGKMPPHGEEPLNQEEIQLIETWVQQGAK